MRARSAKPAAWLAAALLSVAVLVAGCGSGEEAETLGDGDTITVYSSLPLEAGAQRRQAAAILRGIERALADHGGEVDDFTIEHESLDNSAVEDGGPAPDREAANARTASQDDRAVAYIGGLSFAAAAISIPILNEGGMVQVSPGATYAGLTRETPATQPGEPEKYYPTGDRNFARIVPIDVLEARVLAGVIADAGCERAFLVEEEEVASRALAFMLGADLEARGVQLAGRAGVDSRSVDLEELAADAAEVEPDCVAIVATAEAGAALGYRALGEALPEARLFGSEGACRPALEPPAAELPRAVGRRIACVSHVRELDSYPADDDLGLEDPVALYGYEAMRLVLEAIEDGGSNRLAVREALLSGDGAGGGPLGDYRLDEAGDTTMDQFAVYRFRSGELHQQRVAAPGG